MPFELLESVLETHGNWRSMEWGLTAVLVAFEELLSTTSGLIPSNVSMNGGSWAWYMALTPFESLFLCLLMVEICVLRYIEILPINLNNLIHGDPSGRKKRDAVGHDKHNQILCNYQDNVTESMLQLITKLDQQECFLRTLCYIGYNSAVGNFTSISDEMTQVLNGLKLLRQARTRLRDPCEAHDQDKVDGNIDVLSKHSIPFEVAVKTGSRPGMIETRGRLEVMRNNSGSTSGHVCEQHYSLCPLTMSDISHYLQTINIR